MFDCAAASDQRPGANSAVSPHITWSHEAHTAVDFGSLRNPHPGTLLFSDGLKSRSQREAVQDQAAEICGIAQAVHVLIGEVRLGLYPHFCKFIAKQKRGVVSS